MVPKQLGAAAVIVDEAGRVLLVKHSYGKLNWELPGGGAEADESADETALREVQEETGLQVIVERLSGIYYDREVDMHHFVFICRRLDQTAAPRPDAAEITACEFWAPDALPRPISDFTIRRIEDALSGTRPLSIVLIPPRSWLD
ncbi:MAG: NUDIX domain-containing protein [Dehalococcoidia bacterium]